MEKNIAIGKQLRRILNYEYVICIMKTASMSSTGSTYDNVPHAPPHMKLPGERCSFALPVSRRMPYPRPNP